MQNTFAINQVYTSVAGSVAATPVAVVGYEQVGNTAEYHVTGHSDLNQYTVIADRKDPRRTRDSEGVRHARTMCHRTVSVLNPSLETVKRTNGLMFSGNVAVGSTHAEVVEQVLVLLSTMLGEDIVANFVDNSGYTQAQLEAMPIVKALTDGSI